MFLDFMSLWVSLCLPSALRATLAKYRTHIAVSKKDYTNLFCFRKAKTITENIENSHLKKSYYFIIIYTSVKKKKGRALKLGNYLYRYSLCHFV